MTRKFISRGVIRAALALAGITVIGATALMTSTTVAHAAGQPVPCIDIIVQKNPGGSKLVVHSDVNGGFTLGHLAPGQYTAEISSASWSKANGSGAATHVPNIEINYLLQRMSRVPVGSVRLTDSRGAMSGSFTIPEASAKDAQYRGVLTTQSGAQSSKFIGETEKNLRN